MRYCFWRGSIGERVKGRLLKNPALTKAIIRGWKTGFCPKVRLRKTSKKLDAFSIFHRHTFISMMAWQGYR